MTASTDAFNPFAPGFDFLQKLAKGGAAPSGSSFPQWTDWVAPTMNVQDLEKRISELKTVLFWLEQNQRALAATIQAMEVQKMTLSALQTMNVPVDNWASTMVQSWQQFAQAAAPAGETGGASASTAPPAPAAEYFDKNTVPAHDASAPAAPKTEAKSTADETVSNGADPLQWWGALTQQFQQIAQQAMHDVTQHAMEHASSTQQAAASAVQSMGGAAKKRSSPAAKKASTAAAKPKAATKVAAKAATKRAAAPARKAVPARKR